MPDWQSVGAHRYYVDGSLLVMDLQGAVRVEELSEILQPQEVLLGEYERVLTLCVVRDVELPTADVRRYLAARGKRVDIERLFVVIVTQNALLRTMLRLIERATSLLAGSPLHNTFVASEAEAWKWVEAQRREHPPKRRGGP